jgi:adenosine deaminase
MEDQVPTWLAEMPKTELHCHLGGSMRPQTILELADENGVVLPAKDVPSLKEKIVFKNR